jgi:hypothetical protein
MSKKKSRESQTSNGTRRNVTNGKKTRADDSHMTRVRNQQEAWLKGKNVVLVVVNPNTNETNKPFIRKNAKDVWGSPGKYRIKSE